MSPVLATVVVTILIVVDQSWSSPPIARNDQRQKSALEKQSDVNVQRRSVRGNQVLDDAEQADWPPRALVGVNLRRRPSTLVADGDYVDDDGVDKRYMRFGRRSSDETDDSAAAADKRYMRFGRVGTHFHPLMGLVKRYMRFGRR